MKRSRPLSKLARLALSRPIVCAAKPDWTVELLALLGLVLFIAWLMAIAQYTPVAAEAARARHDAAQWKAKATAPPEAFVGVRIQREGVGFRCEIHNVRREWERAITSQCEALGSMLVTARTTP